MSAVRVKPLEWKAQGDGYRDSGPIIYDVYPTFEGDGWWAALSMAGYLPYRERLATSEAAKAAAQADYEARIMSALLPAQTEPDAGRVEVASLLEKAVAEYLLEHPSEGGLQRLGRWAAIRGLMVRVGQYPALCERLNATPPSPTREEIEHQRVEGGARG